MKKLLSLLMVCFCVFGALAGEVVFDPTVDKGQWTGDDTAAAESITKDGVTISCTQGRWNLTDQYRVFKNATFTVSSDQTITKVVIECTVSGTSNYGPGCFTGDDNYTYEGKVGTWTGSSNEITLTASGGQVRMTKVTVTIDGEVTPTLAAPTFSPKGGTYYAAQTVTISGPDGATIYYTTDGTDPTNSSTVYSEPLTISETTTLKAIADNGTLTSAVASAEYTFVSVTTVDNIAAYYALGAGAYAAITNPVTVYYANGNGVWVKDATGYLYIYGRNAGNMNYKNGDVIPGGFGGYLKDYNGLLEMTYNGDQDLFGFQAATTGEATTPTEVTTAYVVESNFGHYITIKNATVTVSEDGRNFTITDAAGTAAGYQAYTNVALPSDAASYNITGIIAKFVKNDVTTIQVYPTLFEKIINIDDLPTVDNIAGLFATDEGTDVKFNNPVTAVYQNGSNLYIKDDSGYALVFGQLENTYNNGDQISGIAGSWKTYGSILEMIPMVSTFGEGTPGTAVEPEVYPIEEIDQSLVHYYLKIENCSMTKTDDKNYVLNDGTGEIVMYLKFNGVTAPEDLTANYDVSGFLTLFKPSGADTPIMEFYPIAIDKVGGDEPIPGDVNGDGVCTASDVTALYNFILYSDNSAIVNGDQNGDGTITASDVTAVYNIILGL